MAKRGRGGIVLAQILEVLPSKSTSTYLKINFFGFPFEMAKRERGGA